MLELKIGMAVALEHWHKADCVKITALGEDMFLGIRRYSDGSGKTEEIFNKVATWIPVEEPVNPGERIRQLSNNYSPHSSQALRMVLSVIDFLDANAEVFKK